VCRFLSFRPELRAEPLIPQSNRGMQPYSMTDEEMLPPEGSSQSDVRGDAARALLRRMARGDELALAALYEGWAERVYSVAYWFLQDADDAADVVGETFWQAWRTAAEYDGARSAGTTWLVMIARSRALDRVRARRRRGEWTAARRTVEALLEQMDSGQTQPPDGAESSELRSAVASALRALPDEQREAVELAFLGGLSHAEIAEETAQPLGTIKTRIRLAMKKLREGLASLREEDE
jgi:RNA polymerase sigma-70 factor, ECF subfamily